MLQRSWQDEGGEEGAEIARDAEVEAEIAGDLALRPRRRHSSASRAELQRLIAALRTAMGEQLASLDAGNTVARSRLQRAAGFLITEVTGWAAGGAPLLGLRLSELLRALLRQELTLTLTLTRTRTRTVTQTLTRTLT